MLLKSLLALCLLQVGAFVATSPVAAKPVVPKPVVPKPVVAKPVVTKPHAAAVATPATSRPIAPSSIGALSVVSRPSAVSSTGATSALSRPSAPSSTAGAIKWINAGGQKFYVRFQRPMPGQTTKDARVTKLVWTTTEAEVTATCQDFFNVNRRNIQLWLSFTNEALQYAGLHTPDKARHMVSQFGLDSDNVAGMFVILMTAPHWREELC